MSGPAQQFLPSIFQCGILDNRWIINKQTKNCSNSTVKTEILWIGFLGDTFKATHHITILFEEPTPSDSWVMPRGASSPCTGEYDPSSSLMEKNDKSSSHNGTIQLKNLLFELDCSVV